MPNSVQHSRHFQKFPDWLPQATRHYLIHTECGISIRELARKAGCHASTVQRQIKKTEARRDDPLVDDALAKLGAWRHQPDIIKPIVNKDKPFMNVQIRQLSATEDAATLEREARRILRRLCEPGACLAVAAEMDKAVVVRETSDGRTIRTAVTDRTNVQEMALKDWISSETSGRILRYHITTVGRAALKRLLAKEDAARAGNGDRQSIYGDQHRIWAERDVAGSGSGSGRRIRYNLAESPVAAMARRKDRDGNPFLSTELVAAAERLREDFELAQMGPRVTQNWDKFLTTGDRGVFDGATGGGASAAKLRVGAVLRDLGPGLGDVVLRVCCFLEGLEAAEKRLGWSARSGKVVLRIALQRLKRHYDLLGHSNLIG